ncbi:MAG: CPBP family intramembrane metalloprotease [Bacteriovoracaceae bacterium]|nr:CPBP family intramembrane metalloprotease [Bacteriovoracaceae bacterium]
MKIISLVLVALYLFLAFFGESLFPFWRGFVPYYYEVGFVIVAFILYRERLSFKVDFGKYSKGFGCSLLFGLATVILAKVLNTELPFAMSNSFVLFFLVIVGPLLEELIFRFALWHGIDSVIGCRRGTLMLTSILFSLAHFKSIFMIKTPFMTFIAFQAVYSLMVSYWWGNKYIESGSISVPTIYHILFNLGFGVGAYFLF